MEITQNSIDNILRCLEEIKSEVQFLSVKPKDEPIVLGTVYVASDDPIHTIASVNGIPINPCDTLTRQHVELVENEKVYRDTYKPTMIPGCPNDVKKENP
jgi:hypothetical protein